MEECAICCSSFTKSLRKKMECSNCHFECCSQCMKQFILSSATEAKCMKCNIALSILFLYRNFSKKFVLDYRRHRQDILWNRELYHLPRISEYVGWKNKETESRKKSIEYKDNILTLMDKINYIDTRWINRTFKKLTDDISDCTKTIKDILKGKLPYPYRDKTESKNTCLYWGSLKSSYEEKHAKIVKLKMSNLHNKQKNEQKKKEWKSEKDALCKKKRQVDEENYRYGYICYLMRQDFIQNTNRADAYLRRGGPTEKEKKKESSYQNRPCITENCKGFLNKEGECPLCKKTTCLECNMDKNDEHSCKQEDIETWNEMKKNTRPCPKCSVRIHKISGCDQMWCVSCNTAFSWTKGTIETGTIHNPHYFEWMFNGNNTVGNEENVNEVCNENRIPHQFSLRVFIEKQASPNSVQCKKVIECYRTLAHIKHSEIPHFVMSEQNIREKIFSFLYNSLVSEESQKKKYETLLTQKSKNDEMHTILETYNRHQIHLIRSLLNETITIEHYLEEYDKYRDWFKDVINDHKKIYDIKRKIMI